MTKSTEATLLNNLRHYIAQNYHHSSLSIWHKLPTSRRSAVFILLFMGNLGEFRVLLTKRSSKLRNFPGHVALPGGKADNGLESEWQVSRREMHEEIGLSDNDEDLKKLGVSIEHLTMLPSYLSRTFSCVKPCVGFMHNLTGTDNDIASKLNIVLNPGESSSVFSCPLKDFLHPTIDLPALEALERTSYKVKWGGIPWDLRSYIFLQNNDNEVEWLKNIKDLSASEEESELDLKLGDELDSQDKASITPPNVTPTRSLSPVTINKRNKYKKKDLSTWGRLGSRRHEDTNEKIYDVWGLTANILHDLAEIVYIDKNKINQNYIGQEEMIYSLYEHGNLMKQKERNPEEVKLIHATHYDKDIGFDKILPESEFNRLNSIYKL
ncbi:peroxisomal coenzyme A diphosphatase, peroxisomal precursor, putative [Candida dubliniensis CD36]|uniref:Peroxisomal coenzyme A diphosphatase, peroxisomal, putative n=1 Tax=Candida dubliniensis (strain CD36 / ATCC MYA-646 / CBS 7987 / NCPF 3949 / NRRL Y-17841) TaxID=573826 RepID=B9WMX8_CANDC|nr:peroxisomal coenzyme A diphosphatase, peroxisomal precursor, putative [Candida dubliniensis CD36]CAX40444.1 peroxisomal coenzyme A diphosphatase, peroxisomal precursor, putative [Candida dubliniensis CD36]